MSTDFGASISEEPSIPALHTGNIRQDQFGRTVIELSENPESSSSNFSETSSGSTSQAANGFSYGINADRSHSVYSNNSEELNQRRDETSESIRKEDQFQDSNNNKETERKSLYNGVEVSITTGSCRNVLNKGSKEPTKPLPFIFLLDELRILNIQGCLLPFAFIPTVFD